MKYLKKFLFVIILFIIMSFNSVDAATGIKCNLDDENISYDLCNTVTINSLNSLTKISSFRKIDNIFFQKVKISDISFLNNIDYELNLIEFNDSYVNLDNLNGKAKSICFKSSIIKDSDFSSLASNTSLTILSLENSVISDFSFLSSLNNLPNLTDLNISNNAISIVDLSPIMSLKNLTKISLLGMEHNVTSELASFISSHNITANSDLTKGIDYMQQLKTIIDELKVMQMNDEEAMKEIINYIINHMEYDSEGIYSDTEGISGALAGHGVCSDYALLTNTLLELAGFKSLDIGGYAFYIDPNNPHAWNHVYLNGKWYGIDATWIHQGFQKSWDNWYLADLEGETWTSEHFPYNDMMHEYIPTFKIQLKSNISTKIETINLKGSSKINIDKIPNIDGYQLEDIYYDSTYQRKFNKEDIINRDRVLYLNYKKVDNPGTGNNYYFIIGILIISFISYVSVKKNSIKPTDI